MSIYANIYNSTRVISKINLLYIYNFRYKSSSIMMKQLLKLFGILNETIKYLTSNTTDEKKLLSSTLNANKLIIFDVGANIGNEIKKVKKILNKKISQIHVFEGNSETYKDLVKIYKDKNVYVNHMAIDNVKNEIKKKFYERTINSHSSLKKEAIQNLENVKKVNLVNVQSLDGYCKKNKINKIHYLKIDTEGNDFNVLKSAKGLIKNKKIYLIKVEVYFYNKEFFFDNCFQEINQYLKKSKYQLISVSGLKFKNQKLLMCNLYYKLPKKIN
jgi:FkbM family methyltransferase